MGWELDRPEEHPLAQVMKGGRLKTCDEVLAEYCMEAAKVSNEAYFEKICVTVLGYRECLNKYGWEKLFEEQEESKVEEDHSPKIKTCLEYTIKQQIRMKTPYSAINGAEKLPEIANEFVLLFAKECELGLSHNEVVEITLNMCEWMYSNKHTKTRIDLI